MHRQGSLEFAWLAIAACLLVPTVLAQGSAGVRSVESQLWSSLLEGYIPSVPPTGGVEVEVGLVISGIKISSGDEMMELTAWWRLFWKDPRSHSADKPPLILSCNEPHES